MREGIHTDAHYVTDNIKEFYQRNDISCIGPGRWDTVSVKSSDGEKVKLQKRHLYSSLKETHSIYTAEHAGFKIGLSKFSMLRPPQLMLGSQTPSNVCTCICHQNTILALDALHSHVPTIPIYSRLSSILLSWSHCRQLLVWWVQTWQLWISIMFIAFQKMVISRKHMPSGLDGKK